MYRLKDIERTQDGSVILNGVMVDILGQPEKMSINIWLPLHYAPGSI